MKLREDKYIELKNIRPIAYSQFKYKRSVKRLILAGGLMGMSLIIPDGSIGIIMGVMILSPLRIRDQIRNKKANIKYGIKRYLIRRGIKR